MSSERRDSRSPTRIRPAAAGPTHPGLRRIDGLAAAVAAAAGRPRAALSGNRGWTGACALLAERLGARPGPPSPLRLVPVRTGRRVVGLALVPGACLSGLAAAVASSRRVPVLVHGDCPAPIAKAAGLRLRKPRPWPGGPEAAARLDARAARVIAGFSTACLAPDGRPGWHSALVYARLTRDEGRAVSALVILSASPLEARLVALPDALDTGPSHREDLDVSLRAAVDAALAAPSDGTPRDAGGGLPSPPAALRAFGIDTEGEDRSETFDYRMRWRLALSQRAALSAFRRSLPDPLVRIAGLLRTGFDRPEACAAFVEARRGWTEEDHRRVLQAACAVPWLLDYLDLPGVVDRARSGAPLEAVVRAATGGERPLHPKAVRALRATWLMRKAEGIESALSLTCSALDALYRADPHRPVLAPAETRNAVAVLVALGPAVTLPRAGAAAILALRGPDGRVGPPPEGLRDFVRWLARAVGRVLESAGHDLPDGATEALAVSIACPPQRRGPGLAAANTAWHLRASGLAHEESAFLAECRPAPGTDPSGPGTVKAIHVLDAPVRLGEVELRPLLTASDLLVEGDALGHCVGSYAWALEAGTCILLGLCSPAGRSTVEARPERGGEGLRLRVVQHRGLRNGPPPPGHADALAAFLAGIPEERIRTVEAGLDARARAERRLRTLDLARLAPAQREAFAALSFAQVQPFLTGPWRRLDRTAWAAQALERARALAAPPS